jgi:hypothetical protein
VVCQSFSSSFWEPSEPSCVDGDGCGNGDETRRGIVSHALPPYHLHRRQRCLQTCQYSFFCICFHLLKRLIYRTAQDADKPAESPVNEVSTTATTTATTERKRPRLDLGSLGTERKRGKSMFGLVLGTLNKAKIEDKERNASEAVCWKNHNKDHLN